MDFTAGIVLFFVIIILVVVIRKKKVDSNTLQDWANFLTVSSVIAAVIWALIAGVWFLIKPTQLASIPTAKVKSTEQTPEYTVTVTTTPIPTVDVLVELIDNYYQCINKAQRDIYSDYEICWNKLSNQPGEFQDLLNQSVEGGNGLRVYFETWNDYKLGYALYFCDNKTEKFVEAEYFRYKWNDYINIYDKNKNYRKYLFGSDQNGPRIKSVDPSITKIDTYCDLQVENWLPSQWTPTP